MHTICLLSLKGGAGKSTVVQSLAVCAVQHGQKTLVVELDPQGTLKNWADRREASEPRVIQTLPQSLGDVLEQARQEEVNWVFLDTPGHNASTASAAAEFADIILIPCKIQSVKDFDSVMASLAEAKRVDKPAYVLMTQVPPNAHRFVRKRQVEIQQHYDVAVLSKHLSRRADFEYCDVKGLSASELNPDGEAANEINRLYALMQSIFIMHRNRPLDANPLEEDKELNEQQAVAIPHDIQLPDAANDTEADLLELDDQRAATVSLSAYANTRTQQPEADDTSDPLADPLDVPSFVKSYNRLRGDT